ncbi:uncharacterized protein EDB93DRAFT_1102192 [Suillus bovinus]|uniref:uncharacterized protein n=1 Tax=Suillus bovinus TaxID=48563 RepID=UPI001B879DC4|nr:uncharacterized protein EDB93DRAFT_1102192 [Suillus bovinus]KAG2154401.1 hypothetical protein EDB93DRAFT_1102192 [Suillus bovinus]
MSTQQAFLVKEIDAPGPGEFLAKIFPSDLNPFKVELENPRKRVTSYPVVIGEETAGKFEAVQRRERLFHRQTDPSPTSAGDLDGVSNLQRLKNNLVNGKKFLAAKL